MSLDDYPEPKGAYYSPALVAHFADEEAATETVGRLREAGFTARDIQVSRNPEDVTVIVSEPTPGMLDEARGILTAGATDVHPYGAGAG